MRANSKQPLSWSQILSVAATLMLLIVCFVACDNTPEQPAPVRVTRIDGRTQPDAASAAEFAVAARRRTSPNAAQSSVAVKQATHSATTTTTLPARTTLLAPATTASAARTTGTVSGIVVDEKGAALPGAEVSVASGTPTFSDGASNSTDSNGRFTLTVWAAGQHTIRATIRDTATSQPLLQGKSENVKSGDNDVRIVMRDDRRHLTLRLISQKTQQPVLDGTLLVRNATGVILEMTQDTTDASVWRCRPWLNEIIALGATSPSAGVFQYNLYVTDEVCSSVQTLALSPLRTVRGRVVTGGTDGKLKPAPDILVRVREIDDQARLQTREIKTDAEGRFEFAKVTPQGLSIHIEPPAPWTRRVLDSHSIWSAHAIYDFGDIVLAGRGNLEVTVVSATGQPQRDKNVSIEGPGIEKSLTAATDSDGIARFPDLAKGPVYIKCETQSTYRSIEPGETDRAKLVLGDGRITLRVDTASPEIAIDPSPVAVNLNQGAAQTVHSERKGNVFIWNNIAPGTWQVSLYGRKPGVDSICGHATTKLAAGESKEVTITLRTSKLSGRITVGGTPAAKASIVIEERDPTETNHTRQTTADDDGRYNIELGNGKVHIVATTTGRLSGLAGPIFLAPGDSATLDLDIPAQWGALRSTAVSYETGEPLPSADFSVYKNGNSIAYRDKRDAQGVVEIPKLPVGTYTTRSYLREVSNFGKHTVEIKAGETVEILDVLQAAGIFVWKLRHDTEPLGNIPIVVTPTDPNSLQPVVNKNSNITGNAYIGGLLPGPYRAEAQTTSGLRATATFQIEPGEFTTRETELR